MKRITNLLSMVLLALSMSLTNCNDDMGVPDNGKNPKDPNFKSIIVMSDIHVMIHNEGNEWKNPETLGLEDQLKSNMENMLRDRATSLSVEESQTELLITSFHSIYNMSIEPGLKSMLTDINQYNDPDKRSESRTDDLKTILRLGR